MTDRRAVGDALGRLAFAAELLDLPEGLGVRVDPAAVTALAWALRSADHDIVTRWREGSLHRFEGMTAPLFAVVDDVLAGRTPTLLQTLEAMLPPGLVEIRGIRGLGPKKVRALWRELEVTSLGELEYACNENRLVELKGFGKKTQDAVLAGIADLRARSGLARLDQARAAAAPLLDLLGAASIRAAIAGDVRRGAELVSDVRLVASASVEAVRVALAALPPGLSLEGAVGDERVRVTGARLPLEVRCAPSGFGWALLEATGSAAHVDALRARATARGVDAAALLLEDEDDVYAALGLLPTAPERRDDGDVLVERGKAGPRLITRADLTGALHNHTTASDGTATLAEMATAAAARGLSWLGITDHSRTASYAHGLDGARLEAQGAEAATWNTAGAGDGRCLVVHGVESDILADGALDYPDEVLARLEVVIASVHHRHGQGSEAFTARMIAAAQNPYTDVIGHPTGRLLLSRAPASYDVLAFLEACATSGCAVELNANPARLDLDARWLAEAKARGVPISIAADAHSVAALDHLDYGVAVARRAGLTSDDVLNARPFDEVRAWLRARRDRALVRKNERVEGSDGVEAPRTLKAQAG